MKLSNILSVAVLATTAAASPAFVSSFENDGVKSLKNHKSGNSIIDRLREKKEFSRFVEVLEKERNLRDELESGKETTVFAPTNKAFKEIEDQWALDERKPEWRDVLRYHIAGESDITADCLHAGALVPTNLRLKSLDDRHQRLRVFKFANSVWLNMRAQIVQKDIEADNGRIHAIDRVLVPPCAVTEMLNTMPTRFSTFSLALERTGLCKEVAREKGLTVFAPSQEAWKNLGFENLAYLFSCHNQQTDRESDSDESRPTCQGTKDLKKIVEHHIGTTLAYSTDIMKKETMKFKTLGREQVTVCAKKCENKGGDREENDEHKDVRKYNFVVNEGEARIQFTDALAKNGAIQVINNVLVPKSVRLPHDRIMM